MILKEGERICKTEKGSASMQSSYEATDHSSHEMEKFLYMWMKIGSKKKVPLNIFTMPTKARNYF